jgi:hypothetical protein
MRDALIARGIPIATTEKPDLSAALDDARALECTYLLKAIIPEWEDNATEWSGKPDVAALSVELYETAEQSLVATATHRVASSTTQGFSRRPERFVPELVDHTLGTVFGWPPSVVAPK